MKLCLLFVALLAPLVICRELRQPRGVTRETLFDAITGEAIHALQSVYTLPDGFYNDPLNLTTVMQLSILSGSVANVAWLLTEYNDSRALGLGFKFPRVFRPRALQTTEDRVTDPDVVAVRGFATAALDPTLAPHLADTFIFSAYGTPFIDRVCTFEEPPVFDDEGVPDCHSVVILDFIKMRMVATFENATDMQRILTADPDVTVLGFRGADLPMVRANVSSWPCAYCFEEAFCLANALHCPFTPPEELIFGLDFGDARSSALAPEADDSATSEESIDEATGVVVKLQPAHPNEASLPPVDDGGAIDVYDLFEGDL